MSENAHRRRVLVVDDSEAVAELTAQLVRTMGHKVHVCLDGTSAMSEAVRFQPDVVLIDLVMPDMDGLELARELRKMFAGHAPTMIALTAFKQPAFRDAASWSGFDAYLEKPASADELRKLLT